MPDIVDAQTRKRMMAGIGSKDTKPELVIRKGLHALGFRYRLHPRHLPGKPDIYLPRYSAAIFINGCFWHGHDCHLFKLPSTRKEFWLTKLRQNKARDERVVAMLHEANVRTLLIWECALRGRTRLGAEATVQSTAEWIKGGSMTHEIAGEAK